MPSNDLAIATVGHDIAAEDAVRALHRAGVDMKRVPIIGKDYTTEEQVAGFGGANDVRRARDVLAATDFKSFTQHGSNQSQTKLDEGVVS